MFLHEEIKHKKIPQLLTYCLDQLIRIHLDFKLLYLGKLEHIEISSETIEKMWGYEKQETLAPFALHLILFLLIEMWFEFIYWLNWSQVVSEKNALLQKK